ncbi:MAG TPA: HAMP domain-containing protein, partial [Kiloniellaceae bacterium]|nr:HAMP domain-containing protein [Kiloniellaceae bacterium]
MKNISKVEPVRRMMAGETGVATFFSPAMQRDMISGFNTVKTSGWGVMVPQPIEELEEKAFEVQLAALAMAMAGLVAAAVISWLIAGFLMRPIDSVVTTARRIAGGDLAARVPGSPPLTPLELRELSGGFNSMAERIEDHQKAMRTALDEARLANRTKSEFLANMSHEFRTPLNAVIGFSDTMRQQILGPLGSARYREYVENIYNSGKHLLAIISDILDLSKIEAGRMDIEDDIFDAAEMIEESLVLIRPRAAEAELTMEVETETGLPPLRASKVKMKQVLVNLLANAVRFTPTGGTVRCSTARGLDGDLHIRISDTGIGMTAEEI